MPECGWTYACGAPNSASGMVRGELLDGVDVPAAGVEAVPDRALGVLVTQPGTHRQQHGRRGVILAGDQLQRLALIGELLPSLRRNVGFDGGNHVERVCDRRWSPPRRRTRVEW